MSGALLKVIDIGAPGLPREVFSAIGLFAMSNSALINMLMASRLVYGMAHEGSIPRELGIVHPSRRSPWVAIAFTTVIAVVLVSTVDISVLGGTTALLLVVFTVVNIAVLVLHREQVGHRHFRTPTVIPVLGALCCAYLVSPPSGRPDRDYVVALVLLAVGLILWLVNRAVMRGRIAERSPDR